MRAAWRIQHKQAVPTGRRQAGIALFISLVVLLLLTIIGVASVQRMNLQVRMARNAHENLMAFQAADFALRQAEAFLTTAPPDPAHFTDLGVGGLWRPGSFGEPTPWALSGVWALEGSGTRVAASFAGELVAPPRYLIEWLATFEAPDNPHLVEESHASVPQRSAIFRITAKGFGPTANAGTLLQSTLGLNLPTSGEGATEFWVSNDLSAATGDLQAVRYVGEDVLPQWRAASQLQAASPSERVIVTSDGGRGGVPFEHGRLNENQRMVLDEAELQWLRGLGNPKRLGTIMRSQPVWVGPPPGFGRNRAPYPLSLGDRYATFVKNVASRPELLYVSANDGMLHAFDAAGGNEVFAFVPNKLIDGGQRFANRLDGRVATPDRLRLFLDLTPTVEDVFIRSGTGAADRAWRTVLIGGLGPGGKGYFALDITDPAHSFSSQDLAADAVLWEFTDADDAYPLNEDGTPLVDALGMRMRDEHGDPVKDLGLAKGQARMGMSNVEGADGEKEWVAVLGNGEGSTAGRSVLFVLFIDRGLDGWVTGEFIKLASNPAAVLDGPNGLGEPALVDLDLNGTVDRAYAGDLMGNLHRFDLSDEDPSMWRAEVIFQVDANGGATQPIATRPQVFEHPNKPGLMLVFGTGQEAARGEDLGTDTQSLYGIWDAGNGLGLNRDSVALVRQPLSNFAGRSGSAFDHQRIVLGHPVRYRLPTTSDPGVQGWRIDFDPPPAGVTSGSAEHPGERLQGSLLAWGNLVLVTTALPDGGHALLPLNFLTGTSPNWPVLDLNEDGQVDDGDMAQLGGATYAPGLLLEDLDLGGALARPRLLHRPEGAVLVLARGDEGQALRLGPPLGLGMGRLSWREIPEFD